MKKSLLWICLFLLGASVTMLSGYRYWKQHETEFITHLERPYRFLLASIESRVFDSTKDSIRPLQLYIFSPNGITSEDMQNFKKFWPYFASRWGKEIEPLMVSRINPDLMINFKGITRFTGTILSDPSGSIGRLFGFWENLDKDDGWHYVLLDGAKKQLLWKFDSEKPMPDADFEKVFRAAIHAGAH